MVDAMTPGIYSIPAAEYHANPALSKGAIDRLLRSPLHYWDHFLNPDKQIKSATPDAFVIGSAVHCAALEPDLFVHQYVCGPASIDRRTNAGKAAWAAFLAEAGARIVLDADVYLQAQTIAHALRTHPTVSKILAEGRAEQTGYWIDPETGIDCKCRPDWLRPGFTADVKTTEDASPSAFQRSIFNYGYHRQAAWYLDGIAAITGEKHDNFVFIAAEKGRPNAVACYVLDDDAIALGRRENRRAAELLQRCRQTNEWPGYPATVQPIALPPYAFRNAA